MHSSKDVKLAPPLIHRTYLERVSQGEWEWTEQGEEGGKAERTGRDRRQNGRWRREVRVTAAIKRSE